MMNSGGTNQSGKDIITQAINEHFANVLNETIVNDSSELSVPKTLNYSYFDERGEFKVNYDSPIEKFSLKGDGLVFITSQVISDDPNFECGDPIV